MAVDTCTGTTRTAFGAWLSDKIGDPTPVGHISRRCRDLENPDWRGWDSIDIRRHMQAIGWLTPSYSECLDVADVEFLEYAIRHGAILHALYRFFDRYGNLLYIGLTMDPGTRWRTHSKEKPWWLEVARITIEHFPSRADVEAAEVAAIHVEAPFYNIIHNGGWPGGAT